MESIEVTTREFVIYTTLINAGLGALFGLIPLITGFVKHQRRAGFWGLILSALGGAILGLALAIPVAAVTTWLVVTRAGKAGSASADDSPAS
jgi:hypothetical protein